MDEINKIVEAFESETNTKVIFVTEIGDNKFIGFRVDKNDGENGVAISNKDGNRLVVGKKGWLQISEILKKYEH